MESARKKSNSRSHSVSESHVSSSTEARSQQHFAVCVRNRGYRASLELRKLYPDIAFAPNDINVFIETPEKTFAEYVTHMTAAATGRLLHHLFTGYLVAEAGEIKLLRESFNPLAMAQAQLPNGVADIGRPGDEVHSF